MSLCMTNKPPYYILVILPSGVKRTVDFNKYETFPDYFKKLMREQFPQYFDRDSKEKP